MMCLRVIAFAVASAQLVAGCGGQDVEPLDPKDLTLPPDTRQWIADAQDGVIAARAARDNALARSISLQKWASAADEVNFAGPGAGTLEEKMSRLAETRVAAAQAEVAVAEASVSLAERKLDLAYAERSMLHDIASYDLDGLRAAVGEAKKFARAQTEVRRDREKKERAAEDAWWKAYSKFAKVGKTDSYWTAGIAPLAQGDRQGEGDDRDLQKASAQSKTSVRGVRGRVASDKKTRNRRRGKNK